MEDVAGSTATDNGEDSLDRVIVHQTDGIPGCVVELFRVAIGLPPYPELQAISDLLAKVWMSTTLKGIKL